MNLSVVQSVEHKRTPVLLRVNTHLQMFRWTLHVKGGRYVSPNAAAAAVKHELYVFERSRCKHLTQGDWVVTEAHVFNTVSLRWRRLATLTTKKRSYCGRIKIFWDEGHTAMLLGHVVYIWGGSPHNDVLHAFDVDTHSWSKPRVSGSVPEGREGHSACVLEKVMFIHGGANRLTGRTDDTYKLDISTMVWSLINIRGTPPPASDSHSATIIGTKMFVFGGEGDRNHYHYIRVFDTETDYWLNTHSAQIFPERVQEDWLHSAFVYNGELYITGGDTLQVTSSYLWRFNPESFSWMNFEPRGNAPSKTYGKRCCMLGDRIILFGRSSHLQILDLSPSLKTLCKLVVIQCGLEQSELPHNIRWELAAMTSKEQQDSDF